MFTLILHKKEQSATILDANRTIKKCLTTWVETKSTIILNVDPPEDFQENEPSKRVARKERVCFRGEMVPLSGKTIEDLECFKYTIIEALGIHSTTINTWIKNKRCKTGALDAISDAIGDAIAMANARE